jgi:hypothetical protein
MKIRTTTLAVVAGLVACLGGAALGRPQGGTPAAKDDKATTRVSGPFDVKLTPLPSDDKGEKPFGRMAADKQIHGPLEGTSHGEMLTAMTAVEGSAAYVALERVDATLAGRKGTFVLQHSAFMTRGAPHLTITVVPDSGTGDLVGIAGTMAIRIEEGGKHFYDFDYSLPALSSK